MSLSLICNGRKWVTDRPYFGSYDGMHWWVSVLASDWPFYASITHNHVLECSKEDTDTWESSYRVG